MAWSPRIQCDDGTNAEQEEASHCTYQKTLSNCGTQPCATDRDASRARRHQGSQEPLGRQVSSVAVTAKVATLVMARNQSQLVSEPHTKNQCLQSYGPTVLEQLPTWLSTNQIHGDLVKSRYPVHHARHHRPKHQSTPGRQPNRQGEPSPIVCLSHASFGSDLVLLSCEYTRLEDSPPRFPEDVGSAL